jgi:hypothetical protein
LSTRCQERNPDNIDDVWHLAPLSPKVVAGSGEAKTRSARRRGGSMAGKTTAFIGLFVLWAAFGAWSAKAWCESSVHFAEATAIQAHSAAKASPISTQAKVEIKDQQGVEIQLQQEEKIAVVFMEAISTMEDDCRHHLNRRCSLDELVKGPQSSDGSIGKLRFDPAKDPNYTYTITITGNSWVANANPRHAGLGGFFYDGGTSIARSYYNANGPATVQDERLGEIGVIGDQFRVRE